MYSYLSPHSSSTLYYSPSNERRYFPQEQGMYRQPFYLTKSSVQFDKISANSKRLKQRMRQQQEKRRQAQDKYKIKSYNQNPFYRSNIFNETTPIPSHSSYQSADANSYRSDFDPPRKQTNIQPKQQPRIKNKQSLTSEIFDTSKIYESIKQSEAFIKKNSIDQNAKLTKPFSFGTKNSLSQALSRDFLNNLNENSNQQAKSYTGSQYPNQSSQTKQYNQNPQMNSPNRYYDGGYQNRQGSSEIRQRGGKEQEPWISRIQQVVENPSYSQDEPEYQNNYPSYTASAIQKNIAGSYGAKWPGPYRRQENDRLVSNRTGNALNMNGPHPQSINYRGKTYYRKEVQDAESYANFV